MVGQNPDDSSDEEEVAAPSGGASQLYMDHAGLGKTVLTLVSSKAMHPRKARKAKRKRSQ